MKLSNETKVGIFISGTFVLALLFAWAIGIQNPFKRSINVYITYHFAGGIEVGSPVRVSGIKVGKVEKIEFFAAAANTQIAIQEPGSVDTVAGSAILPVKLKISINPEAAPAIRRDSRFYINLAGLIGERYVEITPGSSSAPQLKSGDVVAGVDPPRIDQLISQSFDLAGKVKDLLTKNESDITKSIELLYKLSDNMNKMLSWAERNPILKSDLSKLVSNLISISANIRKVTDPIDSPQGEKTLKLLHQLLWRLEPLDAKSIRDLLQKEGVKVQLF